LLNKIQNLRQQVRVVSITEMKDVLIGFFEALHWLIGHIGTLNHYQAVGDRSFFIWDQSAKFIG
jgi:hypothetical protein